MDLKNYIKFYSKKGCKPCEYLLPIAQNVFKEYTFEKITFEDDNTALLFMTPLNIKTVPFMTINDNTIIHSKDLMSLLRAIKPCPKNI